jgi:signal transduction histidine kinase
VLAVVVVALILVTEVLVWQLDTGLKADAENRLLEEASDIRALLEAEISEGIYITIGLESFISSRGGALPLEDVQLWMAALFDNTRHLRNIGIAPNNRISAVFPLEGNETVIGLDYRELPEQWPVIEAMMQNGQASLVGPISLIQGDVGLIYRRPVFVQETYWGLISTVMQLDSILSVLERSTAQNSSYYRIRTTEGDGHTPIAGALSPAPRVSRSLEMELPGDNRWELTVSTPKATWPLWLTRLVLWTLELLIMLYGWQWYRARQVQVRANREKIEFIHTISHELRTPLTSISGALALLGREPQASTASERLLALANRNFKRLERLVSEVLDIARIDTARMSFTFDNLAIGPMLEQAVENNAAFGRAQSIELRLYIEPIDDQTYVYADEQRLLQILDNLLSNAIKFSNPGQHIDLSVKHESQRVEVRVQDYGLGIPDSFQTRLFERFARADHSDKRRNQSGTGLGLSIARDLARHMGGDITVRSKEGEGSCFYLELPILSARQDLGAGAHHCTTGN